MIIEELNIMKMLYITSLSGKRINGFMRSAIIAARNLNIDFTMACNMDMAEKDGYDKDCKEYGINTVHIDFDRNPLGTSNKKAYKQLLALMEKENFDLVHCNTPIGGVLGRICARKAKIPYVIYMAHGFHFWKGAPIKNWLFYYPVEHFLSRWTDVLITINKEDYARAQKFKAKKVCYVPGVGIDLNNFNNTKEPRASMRKSLAIAEDDFVLLSVGELNTNKNHELVLRALADMKENVKKQKIRYLICGRGERETRLKNLVKELGIEDYVHFLGYRADIADICNCSDLFVFMSLREGLPGALMEAMACGLPIICSNIRGNRDLIENEVNGSLVDIDEGKLREEICRLIADAGTREKYAIAAKESVRRFDMERVLELMMKIYTEWGALTPNVL